MRTFSALAIAACLIAACGEDSRPIESQIEAGITTSTIAEIYTTTTDTGSSDASLETDGPKRAESCEIIANLMDEISGFSRNASIVLLDLEESEASDSTRRLLFDTGQWWYTSRAIDMTRDELLSGWDYLDANCARSVCARDRDRSSCPIPKKEHTLLVRQDLESRCLAFWGPFMTQEERNVWCRVHVNRFDS